MAKAAQVYSARTRTAKGRLKPKPKQETKSWQRRNAGRAAKQATHVEPAPTTLQQAVDRVWEKHYGSLIKLAQ